jgi:hypothetical protein
MSTVTEYWSTKFGGLAQLARASALHAEGHRFDSDILHQTFGLKISSFKLWMWRKGLEIRSLNIFNYAACRGSIAKFFDILEIVKNQNIVDMHLMQVYIWKIF